MIAPAPSFSALSRLILNRSGRAVLNAIVWPITWPLAFLQSTPTSLSIAPQDIRTADPTVADDIYAGYFVFSGRVVHLNGQSPFQVEPPSLDWSRQLHSFRWLRHLRAADTALSRLNARALIEDWLNALPSANNAVAWEPDVAARRLMSWLSQSPLILEGVDSGFYRRFLGAIGRHVRFLKRGLQGRWSGETRLLASIALSEAALCADGLEGLQKSASRNLSRELNRQILRDGGTISRNPQALIDLGLDLLPLRQIYISRGLQASGDLQNVLDRIMPMLRMFRHVDGSIALFHGMGVTPAETVATLFAYDEAQVTPILNADASGYQRLEATDAVVLIDTGKTLPAEFAGQAHASALAFEFSAGGQKIFTNCGSAGANRPDMREAGRLTAAHNALTLDNMASASLLHGFWARIFGAVLLDGPSTIKFEQRATAIATEIDASHDGYRHSHKADIRRALDLSLDGQNLAGTDEVLSLLPSENAFNMVLRFHLEPATKVQQFEDTTLVSLILADGAIWDFACKNHAVEVEDSILFADPSGPKRTKQLVIRAKGNKIEWMIQRARHV